MKIGRKVKLGGLLVAGVALTVVVMVALGHSQSGTSQAAAHGAMAVDCDAGQGGVQSDCTYPEGSIFQVEVHVTLAGREDNSCHYGLTTKSPHGHDLPRPRS